MQDKELFDSFKALDSIVPPAGVKDKLLYERILKEKETPVNETADEHSVFSIIEDKRSDISMPEEQAQEQTEEKEDASAPSGEEQGVAAVKQSKALMIFTAAAACIAIIALGAFAFSMFGSKNKIDTTAESGTDKKEKILNSGKQSIYQLLSSDDDDNGADQVFRLMSGYSLLLNDNKAVILNDHDEQIAEKDGGIKGRYLTSSDSRIFTYTITENAEVTGRDILEFYAYDSSTLEIDESMCAKVNSQVLAINGTFGGVAAVPYNFFSITVGEDDLQKKLNDSICYYFSFNYYDKNGQDKSGVYRLSPKTGIPEELYSLSNKADSDEILRIETVYSGPVLTEQSPNIYIIYSKTENHSDDFKGMFKKTYYLMTLDPSGEAESVTEKIAEEYEPTVDMTFNSTYEFCFGSYNCGSVILFNKKTGNAIYVYDYPNVKQADEDSIEYDNTKRGITINYNMSFMQDYNDNYSAAHYSVCQAVKDYRLPSYYYMAENGNTYDIEGIEEGLYNDEISGQKLTLDISPYTYSIETIAARINYKPDGTVSTDFVVLGSGYDFICTIDDVSIDVSNGNSIIIIPEDTSNETNSHVMYLHTDSGVYKLDLHQ